MKENPHIEKTPTLSKDEATKRIVGIIHTILQGGSVDSEPDLFKNILQQMNSNKLSPEDAVRLAEQISSSRQDYH